MNQEATGSLMTKRSTVGAVSVGHHSARGVAACEGLISLRALFHAVAIASVASALTACGGGGGSSSSPAPEPPPAPSPQPLPAQMSVPTPVGYDADKLAAFNRLNELRVAAGLGMLAQDTRLDQAAQAHVNWEVANDVFSHVESLGSPGFTGVNWWDRVRAQGYAPTGGSEVASFGYEAKQGIDGLMIAIYHRAALLQFDPVDVGIGWQAGGKPDLSSPLVVDFASPDDGSIRSAGQVAQSSIDGVVIWPLDGSQGWPTHMGEEEPNPVPAEDVLLLGMPASISVYKNQSIEAQTFLLSEDESGAGVPVTILSNKNDPARSITQSFVGLVPTVALKINTVYRVDFAGAITQEGSSTSSPYTRTWRFTTGDWAYPAQN
jgi:uncharacterized protein YkwD